MESHYSKLDRSHKHFQRIRTIVNRKAWTPPVSTTTTAVSGSVMTSPVAMAAAVPNTTDQYNAVGTSIAAHHLAQSLPIPQRHWDSAMQPLMPNTPIGDTDAIAQIYFELEQARLVCDSVVSQLKQVESHNHHVSTQTEQSQAQQATALQKLDNHVQACIAETRSCKALVKSLQLELNSLVDRNNQMTTMPNTTMSPVASSSNACDKVVMGHFTSNDNEERVKELQRMVEEGRRSFVELDGAMSQYIGTLASVNSRLAHLEAAFKNLTDSTGTVEALKQRMFKLEANDAYAAKLAKLECQLNDVVDTKFKCDRLEQSVCQESMTIEKLVGDIALLKADHQLQLQNLVASLSLPPPAVADAAADTFATITPHLDSGQGVIVLRPSVVPTSSGVTLGSFRLDIEDNDKQVELNVRFLNAKGEWEFLKSIASVPMSKLLIEPTDINETPTQNDESVEINAVAALQTETASFELIQSLQLAASAVTVETTKTETPGGDPDLHARDNESDEDNEYFCKPALTPSTTTSSSS